MMPEFFDYPRTVRLYAHDDDGVYIASYEKTIPPGVGLPRNTTEVEPPETQGTNIPRLVDGAWIVVSDYRGKTFYRPDGEEVVIEDIGDVPPELTEIKPPPPRSELDQDMTLKVIRHIDHVAVSSGFLSILDAISYANDPTDTSRQARGKALMVWRTQCMIALDSALQSERLPEDIISMLPSSP